MINWVFWVWIWVFFPTRLGIWVLEMVLRAIAIPKPNTHKILGMNVFVKRIPFHHLYRCKILLKIKL